ncbi:hypothetical protein T03_3830 [Trichinella britovi]|uniref:Uncharacterized protein n=1 Tax=Trichinella britovi TaxID=45882 RepID=A0A0V1DC75_TRIBR|nr:hypothetical protein T03_3830 [Trichinella britovi]
MPPPGWADARKSAAEAISRTGAAGCTLEWASAGGTGGAYDMLSTVAQN